LEYAKREFERLEPLAKNGIASPTEIAKAQDMVNRGNASIAMANASIEARKLDVEYANVVSPIAGRASKSKLSIGNLVSSNSSLTNVVSISPIYVDIDVDERRLLSYREIAKKKGTTSVTHIRDAKLPVFVALSNETDFPHEGMVVFIDNQVDPLTGTIRVRAEVENPNNTFTPGQFLKVRFPRGDPQQSLIVPDRAIGRDQDRKFVLAVNDKSVVEYREVALGGQFSDGRAISKGLTAGERIILDGLQRARPGQPVTATLLAPATQPSTAK
jgi:RND family efflux transporter MFP subunit